MSRQKLRDWTKREPIRNVVILYDPDFGFYGIWPYAAKLTSYNNMLTSHKRLRECYRTLRDMGYIRETRFRWSTLTDRVTVNREPAELTT